MYPDFKELLSTLNEHKAKYLIIGGYAVGFHAEPRATKDIDILIGTDAKNAKAIYAALASFGAPVENITPVDLVEKNSFFRMGSPPWMVDIIPQVKGIDFNKAWSRRVKIPIDKDAGLSAWVISRDDLIASKLATGRPQDIADVAALRAAVSLDDAKEEKAPTPQA